MDRMINKPFSIKENLLFVEENDNIKYVTNMMNFQDVVDLLNDQDETIKRQAKRIELLESLMPKELIEE